MSRNQGQGRNTAVDFAKHEAERSDEQRLSERVNKTIQDCSKALSRGEPRHFAFAATQMRDQLHPDLCEYIDTPLHSYSAELSEVEYWDWTTLRKFINNADAICEHFRVATACDGDLPRGATDLGFSGRHARDCVEKALRSLTAVAESEGIVHEDYAGTVACQGFSVTVGEWLQQRDMNLGDPVNVVSWQKGGMKALHGGGPGASKSSSMETDAEDFYLYDPSDPVADLDLLPSSEFKLIDIADFEKGESWFYDVPQQDEFLRDIRDEKGVPVDFTEREGDPCSDRQVEVFAPMTDALTETKLPYDTGREEFVVKPFVIPASDIEEDIFVAALESRVSQNEERTLKRIYKDVDNERDDWALKHLADEIREREELSDKHKRGAIGILRELQNTGFIQTYADGPTIDWDRVFSETDTITVFTQATQLLVGGSRTAEFERLFIVLYLIDKIMRERGGDDALALPELNIAMRELWEIVPHSRRTADEERAAAIQEAIGSQIQTLGRKNRHYTTNVTADTQYPYDLDKSVRGAFNKYIVHDGTSALAEGVMNWTGNNSKSKINAFSGSFTPKRGQASIAGELDVAINNRGIAFAGPVEYIPPSHHHWDKENDLAGWKARCKYFTPIEECPECGSEDLERGDEGVELTCLDCGGETRDLSMGREEVRRSPDWDTEIPGHLEIEAYSPDNEEGNDDEEGGEEQIDPKAAHRLEARNRNRRGESVREIAENVPNNPDTGEPYNKDTIWRWTKDVEKGSATPEGGA